MSTIIRSVYNTTEFAIKIDLGNVVVPPATTVDLFDLVTDDVLLAMQGQLNGLVERGSLTVMKTEDSEELRAGGFALDQFSTVDRDAQFVEASLISQGVTYTSKLAGTVGNDYSVTVVDSAVGGLAYIESAGNLTIDLGGDTVTAADVVLLIGTTTPSAFVDVAGTVGDVLVHDEEFLSGGIKPQKGKLIYNTTTNKMNVFTTTWEEVTSA